jgi:hypothetical protein
MSRPAKSYSGRAPNPDAGWRLAGAVEVEGLAWNIYKRGDPEAAWMALKIAAVGRAPRKGNYWLAYSQRDARFVESGDAVKLFAHRPRLAAELLRWAQSNAAMEVLGGDDGRA